MLSFISQSMFIWAILQSILMAFAVTFIRRGLKPTIICVFFGMIAMETLFQFIYAYYEKAYELAIYMFTFESANLLYGPLVYIISFASVDTKNRNWIWHLMPSMAFMIHYLFGFVIPYHPLRIDDWVGSRANFFWLGICGISLLGYFMAITWRVKSNARAKDYSYAKSLLIFLPLKGINALIAAIYIPIYRLEFEWYDETIQLKAIIFIVCNAYMIFMTFFLLFSRESSFWKEDEETRGIDLSEYEEDIKALHNLMTTDMVFRKSDISKESLAQMLDIQPYVLSRLINESYGKSFWDYINEARVDYAKQLLLQGEGKVLAVAIKAGYNSESVFYKNFRKLTGMTPRKFQESQKSLQG